MNLPGHFILAAASGGSESQPLDLGGATSSAHAAGGGSIAKTIVGLAIVLAVIFGLRWVMKQYKSGREKKAAGTGLAYHNIRKAQAAEPVLAETPASAPEAPAAEPATTAGGS